MDLVGAGNKSFGSSIKRTSYSFWFVCLAKSTTNVASSLSLSFAALYSSINFWFTTTLEEVVSPGGVTLVLLNFSIFANTLARSFKSSCTFLVKPAPICGSPATAPMLTTISKARMKFDLHHFTHFCISKSTPFFLAIIDHHFLELMPFLVVAIFLPQTLQAIDTMMFPRDITVVQCALEVEQEN